jgi:hypothetical protein
MIGTSTKLAQNLRIDQRRFQLIISTIFLVIDTSAGLANLPVPAADLLYQGLKNH